METGRRYGYIRKMIMMRWMVWWTPPESYKARPLFAYWSA